MTTSEKSNLRRQEANPLVPIIRYLDNMFEDFRRKIDSMFHLWPYSMTGWLFPLLADIDRQIWLPLCYMVDRGDKYELQLEIPGIDKDKIDVKATKNSVEIIGEQSEKSEEKKNYVYNERSFRSFHRRIPIPEEIVPRVSLCFSRKYDSAHPGIIKSNVLRLFHQVDKHSLSVRFLTSWTSEKFSSSKQSLKIKLL